MSIHIQKQTSQVNQEEKRREGERERERKRDRQREREREREAYNFQPFCLSLKISFEKLK